MAEVKEIRLYRPGDETGIIKLFKEIFNREMSLQEWRWKYVESHPEKNYSSVAVHPELGIVGHYGGVYHQMICEGNTVKCIAICDVMIHPQFRGIKTLKTIAGLVPAEAVKDGFVLGYGFPNKETLFKPALHLGIYEKVEDVYESIKEVMLRNTAERYLFKFFPLSFDDSRINILWNSVQDHFKLAVVRDREYLKWRYQKHPFLKYELWGLKGRLGNALQGIAVLRQENEHLLLVDFICRSEKLPALFLKVENYAFTAGRTFMVLWHPEYFSSRLLSLGYSVKPSLTCIPRTTHALTLIKEDIKGKFFYTMGDTDFL